MKKFDEWSPQQAFKEEEIVFSTSDDDDEENFVEDEYRSEQDGERHSNKEESILVIEEERRIAEPQSAGKPSAFESFMDFVAFPEKHLFEPKCSSAAACIADEEYAMEDSQAEHRARKEEEKPEEISAINMTATETTTVDANKDSEREKPSISKDRKIELRVVVPSPSQEADPNGCEGSSSTDDYKTEKKKSPQTVTTPCVFTPTPRSRAWLKWLRRNERIAATIHKEKKEEPLGIFIKKLVLKDGLYISNMQETSRFAQTDLKIGMKILTINKMQCPETVKEFKALVGEMVGDVTIVAEMEEIEEDVNTVVSIYKETRTEPLGVYLMKRMLKNGLFVSKIREDSKFHNSDLKVGMKIVKINGHPCPPTVQEFIALLAQIDGEVTIVAEPGKSKLPPVLLEETVVPEAPPMRTVTVVTDGNDVEMVDSSEPDIFALRKSEEEKSKEEPAPKIVTLNGEQRKEVVCTVSKKQNETLGLLLREFKGEEGIHVLQVYQKSKMASTTLQPGMTIHRINGAECPKNVEECIELLRNITGRLEIVASELFED